MMTQQVDLSTQLASIEQMLDSVAGKSRQAAVEATLYQAFCNAHDELAVNSTDFTTIFNQQLYRYILKHYKHGEEQICLWRFIKSLTPQQLEYQQSNDEAVILNDHLLRVYFYSDPLDDLSCIFIPINDSSLIKQYLNWVKSYFYKANYPTSLLWFYALDSSVVGLFPEEIIYFGRRTDDSPSDIMLPDFTYTDTVLIKRYTAHPDEFVVLEGVVANRSFRQTFNFLEGEYGDRCLSHSGGQNGAGADATYVEEWEKFEDVLKFGVSDQRESGCISFSDMRSSTDFLNTYGKAIYLNKIQQPFFERTKLIKQRYFGRIDKFMGDNVMCVFLNRGSRNDTLAKKEKSAILNNLFALFSLCRVLNDIMIESGFTHTNLGLRSGLTYGDQILRSNLGNEIVRDFTVTGQTVNLAARLEHISAQELHLHNEQYFQNAIERFPEISKLIMLDGTFSNLNPETKGVIQQFTLYQNITSNLRTLSDVKFDIRLNHAFYQRLRAHLLDKGYPTLNQDIAETYGCETFVVEGFQLNFYFSFYKPKGFAGFEKMWIFPLSPDILRNLDIEKIR